MEVIVENFAAYFIVGLLSAIVLFFYLKGKKVQSISTETKIKRAMEYGFHEPVSLHPVINNDICIGSGACVTACPENDILGLINGKVQTINASHCVGHGACFHACPVQAISLVMGTEKRGVELPHVSSSYETNVPGIYIAGELGGMGLIKNAVEQGKLAMENLTGKIKNLPKSKLDVIIVGGGPAGISASLTAKKNKLNFVTLEQDSLGGTVFAFPRAKIVMTSPMELPLHGKVKLIETSKTELLELWNTVLNKNNIKINENEKVLSVSKLGQTFEVVTSKQTYETTSVLLTIGRRGSPRKLDVPGEEKEKVSYRLLEPELIHDKNILVVGGGDSAIESALLLAEEKNRVVLSYRGESFSRLKPKNLEKINNANANKNIRVILNSNVKEILDKAVIIESSVNGTTSIENDLVYIFAGGELPNKFLNKIGIRITEKFGETILKH
jgi:thioredoxin reductase